MNSLPKSSRRFFPDQHDHGDCVASALEDAIAVCSERGVWLTPARWRVLETIWQGHPPLGTYAILEVLAGEAHSPAPPTVYRALEFPLTQGLVHRPSSLNAFVGCSRPGHPGAGQFLLCTACGTAAEGCVCRDHTVEISGLCSHCREAGPLDSAPLG